MYRGRKKKRYKTTDMPCSTFYMHPCYRHTQNAMPASAVECVSSLSPSCHPCCHSSASLIHVLPGPCASLSSHAPNGSMQKSNYANCQIHRVAEHLHIHLPWRGVWLFNTQPFHPFYLLKMPSQGLRCVVWLHLLWHGFRAMWGDVWLVVFLGCNLSCPTSHNASGVKGNQSQLCTSSRYCFCSFAYRRPQTF